MTYLLILPDDESKWFVWVNEADTPGERSQRKQMLFKRLYSSKPTELPFTMASILHIGHRQ
jgi:hypothetical protein